VTDLAELAQAQGGGGRGEAVDAATVTAKYVVFSCELRWRAYVYGDGREFWQATAPPGAAGRVRVDRRVQLSPSQARRGTGSRRPAAFA